MKHNRKIDFEVTFYVIQGDLMVTSFIKSLSVLASEVRFTSAATPVQFWCFDVE